MSGNGIDIGSIVSMLRSVLDAQEQLRVEMLRRFEDQGRRLETQGRRVDDLTRIGADLRTALASLRQEVAFYHSSSVGNGIAISEFEVRLRRIEEQLNLA